MVGLFNVYLFLCFVLSFFAILGVNLFNGYQYRACRTTAELVTDATSGKQYWPNPDSYKLCNSDEVCWAISSEWKKCGSVWLDYGLDPFEIDGVIDNPVIFYGIQGFDNYWKALLTVFQICTLEGWSSLMFNQAEAIDYPFTSYIYFILLVVIGSFFTLNLILA